MKKLVFTLLGAATLTAAAGAQKVRGITDFEVVEATLDEVQAALSSGELTSEDIVRAYLARIEAYDEGPLDLNAFLFVNPNALELAKARDAERAAGAVTGPLFGIPVVLKDNIDTVDMPTTAGSVALAGSIPPDDAFIAARLRAAGAILLGKVSLTEWANFMTTGMPGGYSSLGGRGRNPYDAALSPGGSSSGPGIAVSANLAMVGVGTETSGSILNPSSQNGLVGIKPTLGLVSRTGIVPITSAQDTAGPMTRTVTDAAILLGAIAGFDEEDLATLVCTMPGVCHADYTRFLDATALDGARIAVPRMPYWNFLSGDQRRIMRQAITVMRNAGATVDNPQEIPGQSQLNPIGICVTYPPPDSCSTVLLFDFKRDLNAYLASRGPQSPVQNLRDVLIANIQKRQVALRFGQSILAAANRIDVRPGSPDHERYLADRERDLLLFRGALNDLYDGPDDVPNTDDDYDAILFGGAAGADIAARAGYPSVCLPGGVEVPGGGVQNEHPFGITFSGPAFSEPRLIGLAYAFEQLTEHRFPPPSTPPLDGPR